MILNKEVAEILKQHNIDVSTGTLVLLGIYFKLDIEKVYSEDTIKAINLTKIVDKDYKTGTLNWNISLFEGQETAFDWVTEWNNRFGKINPDRKGSSKDVLKRMKDFFAKYPEYRKEDVIKATETYFKSLSGATYLKNSAAFIFDGAGAMKKSILLGWCERTKDMTVSSNIKGKLL